MSKKLVRGIGIAFLAVAIISSGAVFAAGDETDFRGPKGGDPAQRPGNEEGLGLMEEYMVQYIADELDISVEEIQDKLDEGLTLTEVLSEYDVEDVRGMAVEAREYAVEQLKADGIDFPGYNRSENRQGNRGPRSDNDGCSTSDRSGRNRR